VAIAPDFDLVLARVARLKNLAADCGRGLFAASCPRAEWPVNIVEPGDPRLHAIILMEVAAHALAEELFPSVAVFAERGIGILFFEGTTFSSFCLSPL